MHVRDLGLLGHVDDEVLETARHSGRTLVSPIRISESCWRGQVQHYPALSSFGKPIAAQHQAGTLIAHLADIAADIDVGAIVVH